MKDMQEALTFDDVLLVPHYSEITSRSMVDLSVNLPKGFKFSHPMIPANMKTVTEYDMAKFIVNSGGLALIHRFMPVEDQLNIFTKLVVEFGLEKASSHVGLSIGVQTEDMKNLILFQNNDVRIVCIDVAHAHSQVTLDMCDFIKNVYPQMLLIAGNVATKSGTLALWQAGADVVRVGIGNGSICTTRIETGNGVPQLTALMEAAKAKIEFSFSNKREVAFISDGGAKSAGDCVKALAFANMVMSGNLFAGTDETPGKLIRSEGVLYKEYVGSSTHRTNHVEGVIARVVAKGPVEDVLRKILEGIKSGCAYQNAKNLTNLKNNSEFIRVTNAGLVESRPHDVIINSEGIKSS